MACASVRGAWWPGKDGIVRFSQVINTTTIMALTDTASGVSYVDYQDDYGSASVINALEITNHGRNPVDGNTNDVNYVITDDTLAAQYGPRKARVDFSLLPTLIGGGDAFARRSSELFAELGEPRRAPYSVTFDAMDALVEVSQLDLYSAVSITHKGTTHVCRVVGVNHEISVNGRWLVTLKLRKI